MKKTVISLFITLVLMGGTLWFVRYMSGTELHCRSTFEKNTVSGLHVKGVIAVHLFRDHTGVASMAGKVMTADGHYTLNRETGFTHELVDARKGVYRVKKTYFRTLSRDNMPARYDNGTDMNTASQDSDYMIIRKINTNTFLLTSPAAPVMLCVSE